MSNVAVILTDLFEDSEYEEPTQAFIEKGHQVTRVGLKEGQQIKGKKKGLEVTIDTAVSAVSPRDFDALLIPGGYSPDKLRIDPDAVRFVREFVESGKPVFSICHAPQLLITADVLRGRRIAGYESVTQDIKNAGAEYVDEAVVVDGNLISSRHPGDLPAFTRASLQQLA